MNNTQRVLVRDADREKIMELSRSGLSTRAIAARTGWSQAVVSRTVRGVVRRVSPEDRRARRESEMAVRISYSDSLPAWWSGGDQS